MRILGIDLGTTSLKAVSLDSIFGRYEINDYYEISRQPNEPIASAIHQLMGALPKSPDRIAVCLPSGQVTFRNLNVPTKDRKALNAAVEYELEDEVPFELSDCAIEQAVTGTQGAATQVHAAVTPRKHLEELIEVLQSAGVDPDVVTTESWAYRSALNRILKKMEIESPVLLLKIGHRTSTLHGQFDGNPLVCREIAWGGQTFTHTLAAHYSITDEEAERAKIENGFLVASSHLQEVTPEQQEFSQTLHQALDRLVREIRQAALSIRSQTGKSVGKILISGPTSLMPGLRTALEEETQVQVQILQSLTLLSNSAVKYSEMTDANLLTAVATALAVAVPEKGRLVNFRKNEYAKKDGSTGFSFSDLRAPLIGASIVSVFMLISQIAQYQVYGRRLEEANERLEKSVKSYFNLSSKNAVKQQLASLAKTRATVKLDLDRSKEMKRLQEVNTRTPLRFLREVSQIIGKDTVVDLIQFNAGAAPEQPFSSGAPSEASLTFIVANPQVAEKIAVVLEKAMSAVQKGKMEEVDLTTGTGKGWKITFTGKIRNEAFGK